MSNLQTETTETEFSLLKLTYIIKKQKLNNEDKTVVKYLASISKPIVFSEELCDAFKFFHVRDAIFAISHLSPDNESQWIVENYYKEMILLKQLQSQNQTIEPTIKDVVNSALVFSSGFAIDKVIGGALFDFMGWLTTRENELILSAHNNSSPAVDAIREFAKLRGIDINVDPLVYGWENHLANGIKRVKPHWTDSFQDGFYLLTSNISKEVSLVKLYNCPDFNGIRHIAFGPWDGAAVMPVTDLSLNSILRPVEIKLAYKPSSTEDIENEGRRDLP